MIDWEGILRRDGPAVWRCACRLLGRADEAEECFQETFVAAMEAFARGPVRDERALLLRLATARAMDRLRAALPAAVPGGVGGVGGVRRPRAAPAGRGRGGGTVGAAPRAALATLPARQADAFCLHCLEGWSYQAIAEQMRVSVDAVGVLLHRAGRGCASASARSSPATGRPRGPRC